jgi:hypothetical protein
MFEHCYASSQITIVKGNNGFLFSRSNKIFLIWNKNSNKSSPRANENALEKYLEQGKSQSETIKSKGKRDSFGKIKGRDNEIL